MREKGIELKNYGIRLDSGDLSYLSKKARQLLDNAGFNDAIISASNDLDENLISSLKLQGAKISSWGVGTNLITSKDCPAFGGVYKLSAVYESDKKAFKAKIKLSENAEKNTNPGNKKIYRIYDKDTKKIIADLICLEEETLNTSEELLLFDPLDTWKKTLLPADTYYTKELLVPVFKNGNCVYQSPSVMEIREYCKEEMDTLWEESRRLEYPHRTHVDLSQKLWDLKNNLLNEYHK